MVRPRSVEQHPSTPTHHALGVFTRQSEVKEFFAETCGLQSELAVALVNIQQVTLRAHLR